MIGISTYAYQWRMDPRGPEPWPVERVLDDAARLGLRLVQLCDLPELDDMSRAGAIGSSRLAALRSRAEGLGLRLELGTKGIRPGHLLAYLRMAGELGSDLVRSMLVTPDHRPTLDEARRDLASVLPEFAASGVTLALETYEQVSTAELVGLVAGIGAEHLGICLDPGNVVARLEHPREVVEITAPWVRNVHVKDFDFSRSPDMVGFRFAGRPLGDGLLDYGHLMDTVAPESRGINRIIEQWVPDQGDPGGTIAVETEWAEHAVRWLRERDAEAASR